VGLAFIWVIAARAGFTTFLCTTIGVRRKNRPCRAMHRNFLLAAGEHGSKGSGFARSQSIQGLE
jgi:hypothetical protein